MSPVTARVEDGEVIAPIESARSDIAAPPAAEVLPPSYTSLFLRILSDVCSNAVSKEVRRDLQQMVFTHLFQSRMQAGVAQASQAQAEQQQSQQRVSGVALR